MTFPLKNYQEKAVKKLLEEFEEKLEASSNKTVAFQAPTGSGKTVIVAEFVKRFVEEHSNCSFMWVAPLKLHTQSKDKLEEYYSNVKTLTCSSTQDLHNDQIGKNEILFINWEKMNRIGNILREGTEKQTSITEIIENTKNAGNTFIMIIDESHFGYGGEETQKLVNDLTPKISLEVSATLKQNPNVEIDIEEVKAEEMIKDKIIVNPNFKSDDKTLTEKVVDEALKKRDELKKLFEKDDKNINPLLLIQLPSAKEGEEPKRKEVEAILQKNKITEGDGNLAVWLSDEPKDTLDNIEKKDNKIEVLIFKQAIAIGWDCPRAAILVIFRESKSVRFTIQVIGRIMRMPEWKYYENSELNNAFIFTNLSSVETRIDDVTLKGIVHTNRSFRDKKYQKISLPSVYLKKRSDRKTLSKEFLPIFKKIAAKEKNSIETKPSKIIDKIVVDGETEILDKVGKITTGGDIEQKLGDVEINKKFDAWMKGMASPFTSKSSDWLREALYDFLDENFGVEKLSSEAQRIILGEENTNIFSEIISKAKNEFSKQYASDLEAKRVKDEKDWEIPETDTFSSKHVEEKSTNSIMKPLYIDTKSKGENNFVDLVNGHKNVKWWYKNGESSSDYFSITTKDEETGKPANFLPDFIICMKDGSIGLFDTKSGDYLEKAGNRSDSLQKYIRDQNKKGKKLWGGITTQNESGIFVYYNKEKWIKFIKGDFSNFDVLKI